MNCSQCNGVGFLTRKLGKAIIAKRCSLCTSGSLFNQKPIQKKRKRKA